MKNFLPKLHKVIRSLAIAGIVAFPLCGSLAAHAATQNAQFYLAPTPQTATSGSAITVTLMMNSGGNSVFTLKADLTYSTSYFSSVSVATAAGSPFIGVPSADLASGGNVSISRFSTTASTYSGAVATITLQSNGAVGSSSLDFKSACASTANTNNCSAITDGANNELLSSLAGGTIAVTAVPVSGGGSGTATGSGSAGGTTTTTKKTISFSAKTPTSAAATTVTTPAVATTTSTDNTDATAAPDGRVTITVLDQHNKPVSGAIVIIGSTKGTTDKNGQVTLRGLTPGTRSGSISYGGKSQTISVKVASGSGAAAQKFTIQTKNTSVIVPASLAALALIIIGVLAFLFFGRDRSAKMFHHTPPKTPSGLSSDPDLQFHATARTPAVPASVVPLSAKLMLPTKPLPILPIMPAPAPVENPMMPSVIEKAAIEVPMAKALHPSRPLTPRGASLRERAMEPGTIIRPTIDGFHRA